MRSFVTFCLVIGIATGLSACQVPQLVDPGADLVQGAVLSLNRTTGFAVIGSYIQAGKKVDINLEVAPRASSAHLTGVVDGLHFEALRLGGRTYYRGRDFLYSVLDPTMPTAPLAAQTVKDGWFTRSRSIGDNLDLLTSPVRIRDDLLNPADVHRRDQVKITNVPAVELTGNGVTADISQGLPHRLLRIRTERNWPSGIASADLTFSRYDEAVGITQPANSVDIDDPNAMAPDYQVYRWVTDKCLPSSCSFDVQLINRGGIASTPAHSSITINVMNVDAGKVAASCSVTISSDVRHDEKTEQSCSISEGYDSFDFEYRSDAVLHNPTYDQA